MKEIRKIIEHYDAIDWDQEQTALGTVVKIEESAFRRIGARMFVSSKGFWTGGISGGCLEGDALKRANIAIAKEQSSVVVYDTLEDDAHQIGVGLGCNGRIDVLFKPVNPNEPNNAIEQLRKIYGSREPQILLQIIHSPNENILGRLYGPEQWKQCCEDLQVETSILEKKLQLIRDKNESHIIRIQNNRQENFEILAEVVIPRMKLICVGDNYDVSAFLGITHELGWEVHVVGKMRKMAKPIFQYAHQVYAIQDFDQIEIDPYTAVVLMSHDYKTDLTILRSLLDREVPYVGLLGPKKRMIKMQNDLASEGWEGTLEELDNIYGPVGLDIGAENPEEIALSIASEILAHFRDRNAQSLKERTGPIHERKELVI